MTTQNGNSLSDYQAFLHRKTQLGSQGGFAPLWLPDVLFDFQRALVEWAIRKGCGALFAGTGLGKTIMQLVWAENVVRHTNSRVLILAPVGVGTQTVHEGEKFGIECHRSRDGQLGPAKIIVTNYEQLHQFDPTDFVGVVCDESSRLKHFGGATQKQVTRFLAKLPYRLLCTATPAPNDFYELGTSAEALGEMNYSDMLSRFFKQDDHKLTKMRDVALAAHGTRGQHFAKLAYRVSQQIGQWHLKVHAETAFWRWVCSWAKICAKPSDLGFADGPFQLPPLNERHHIVIPSRAPDGMLFSIPVFGLQEERGERRRTLEERCTLVADLVSSHDYSMVWCHLNTEGDLLEKMIPNAVQVKGADSIDHKEEALEWFSRVDSETPKRIISKATIFGYGINAQHCAHVVTFASHCYDETTELLTKRGWLTFGQVGLDDEVATVNRQTLAFEWQHPTEVIWSPYQGQMIHFYGGERAKHSKNFDLVVTPNHKMFVKRCERRYGKKAGMWMLQEAEHLRSNFKRLEYRMLSAPKTFIGNRAEIISIPFSAAISENNKTKRVDSLPAATVMALAGWYISEGYAGCRDGQYDGQITICQTDKNPECREEIIALLQSIPGMNVYHKTKDIRCCSRQLALFLVEQFGAGSHRKRIPRWVKELEVPLLMILRDTMLKGDGCSHKRGGKKWFYRTVSRQLADDFAEICLKTGIRASVRYRVRGSGVYGGGVYDVSLARDKTEPSIHVRPETIDYQGMVGCASVPNRTLIVRRNGIPIVSGNSWEQYYQSIRRCWRFGQTRPVMVDVISTEGEKHVRDNMLRKDTAAQEMFKRLVSHSNDALKLNRTNHQPVTMEVPTWL